MDQPPPSAHPYVNLRGQRELWRSLACVRVLVLKISRMNKDAVQHGRERVDDAGRHAQHCCCSFEMARKQHLRNRRDLIDGMTLRSVCTEREHGVEL